MAETTWKGGMEVCVTLHANAGGAYHTYEMKGRILGERTGIGLWRVEIGDNLIYVREEFMRSADTWVRMGDLHVLPAPVPPCNGLAAVLAEREAAFDEEISLGDALLGAFDRELGEVHQPDHPARERGTPQPHCNREGGCLCVLATSTPGMRNHCFHWLGKGA